MEPCNSLLSCGTQEAHDFHVVIRTFFRAEAAGNLLLHLAESDGTFRFVIGKRHLPIPGEKQNIPLLVPQALQKTDDFPFRNAPTLPR